MANSSGLTLAECSRPAKFQVRVIMSDTDIGQPRPAGPEGSLMEMDLHKAMWKYRDEAHFDEEWRYYVLVVRKIRGMGGIGVM